MTLFIIGVSNATLFKNLNDVVDYRVKKINFEPYMKIDLILSCNPNTQASILCLAPDRTRKS